MIVITIEGGIIQGISSDDPVDQGKDVAVIEYETEWANPKKVHKVPQGKGETTDATIERAKVGVLFRPVAKYLKTARF
ncbi:MAG: hypothetical protein WCJ63_08420 [Actinomycetes bacterium]